MQPPKNEGDNQEEKPTKENNNPGSEEDEADYSEEQYPPADDKYKQLEDRLNAMEIQRIPGLDFEGAMTDFRGGHPTKIQSPCIC